MVTVHRGIARLACLVVAGLAMLSAPDASAASGLPRASQDDCANVVFIGIRGSGEPESASELGMGTTIFQAYNQFRAKLPQTWDVEGAGLTGADGYSARPVTDLITQGVAQVDPRTWHEQSLRTFTNSVATGRDALVARLNHGHAACPDTKYVIAGYSQGAMVAHQALNRLGDSWPGADAVIGVLLVADGDKMPGSDMTTVPNDMRNSSGVRVWLRNTIGRRGTEDLPQPQDVPARYRSRAVQLAFKSDVVADFSIWTLRRLLLPAGRFLRPPSPPAPLVIHQGYASSPQLTQAVEWLRSVVLNSLSRDLTPAQGAGQGSRSIVSGAQLHYFDRSSTNALAHWWRDTPAGPIHQDTWPLPVAASSTHIAGRPIALADGLNQHVWARVAAGPSTSSKLVHWVWNGMRLESQVWPAAITDDPSAMSYDTGASLQLHVFARTVDGKLGHWWLEPDGQVKSDLWPVAGTLASGAHPLSYPWRNQQHVFAAMSDGSLRHWWWYPGLRQPLTDLWAKPGDILPNPAGFAYRDTQQHVYVVRTDHQLLHRVWRSDGSWPVRLVGLASIGTPAVFTDGNRQHVATRNPAGDLLLQTVNDDGVPRPPRVLGAAAGDPTVTSWCGRLIVFSRRDDGRLQSWCADCGGNQPVYESWDGDIAR